MSLSNMLSKAVGAAFLAGAALVAVPVAANAAPAITTEPAQAGTACIPEGSGIGIGAPKFPIDKQANVYVGGNFHYLTGAELEGLLVVEGDATFDSGTKYNMGVVGAGSLMTPEPNSDMLIVGGDMTIASGGILLGDRISGKVRVGGTLTALDTELETNGGLVESGLGKAEALGDWVEVGTHLQQQSAHYAAMPATGSATLEGETLVLEGDGTTDRQVFTLAQSQLDSMVSLKYSNIDPDAIVVVNVTGDTAHFGLKSMLKADGMPMDTGNLDAGAFGSLTQRLLWNIPDATAVTIGTDAQFPGTVLVANPDSSTVMKAAGTNGRFWVAGDLEHNRSGSEFHAFPFLDNDVFSCTPVPPTVGPGDPVEPGDPVDPVDPQPLIELATPKVTQAVCLSDDKIVDPVIEFVKTAGVNFTIDGEVTAGATVTVTASATGDRLFAETKGWTLSADAKQATMRIVLDNVVCENPAEPEPEPGDSEKPNPEQPGDTEQPEESDDPKQTEPGDAPEVEDSKSDEPQSADLDTKSSEQLAQPLEKKDGLAATGGAPVAGLVSAAVALLIAGFATVAVARKRKTGVSDE